MPDIVHLYAFGTIAATLVVIWLGLRHKQSQERLQMEREHLKAEAQKNGDIQTYESLSRSFVEVHANVEAYRQQCDSMQLRINELSDMLERRYNQLRQKIYRDSLVLPEDDETPQDVENAQLLLGNLGSAAPGQHSQEPPGPHGARRRLRRRSRRRR